MTTQQSSFGPSKVPVGLHSPIASSWASVSDSSSWEELSDHRDCHDHLHHAKGRAESDLDAEEGWVLTSRPASPPLEVPATSTEPWLHVQRFQTDHQIALQLYAELEGRPFRAATPSIGGETMTTQGSDETLRANYADIEPVRYAHTPPPEPADELETALKHFQQSEGSRLYGYQQCSPEARASLIKYLMDEGNDEQAAIFIADEIDGFEELNGLARNEHGVWYRIKEGEKGRNRQFDPLANLKPEYYYDKRSTPDPLGRLKKPDGLFTNDRDALCRGMSYSTEKGFHMVDQDEQKPRLAEADETVDISDFFANPDELGNDETSMAELRRSLAHLKKQGDELSMQLDTVDQVIDVDDIFDEEQLKRIEGDVSITSWP